MAMHTWFECKIRYEKVMENGMQKKVTEPYLVDALSFTEAEARIIEEMTPFISGEFTVSDIKKTLKSLFSSKLDKGMKGTMADYQIGMVSETPLMDVYPYSAEPNDKPEFDPSKA